LSFCTMVLIDQILELYFDLDGIVIGMAVIAFWLGSHYLWYCMREPFMIHIVSGFWVTMIVFLSAKLQRNAIAGRIHALDIFLISAAMSMAIVGRPSDIFIAPVILWSLWGIYRAGMLGKLLRVLPIATLGLFPLLLQAWIWHTMDGSWFHYSYTDESFVWLHPALLQTLFSIPNKGLFIWTPLIVLSAIGLIWHLSRPNVAHKGLLTAWLISAALLWYINSAWWFWGFGWSFGARAFLALIGLFVVGLALMFEWARRWSPPARRALVAGVILCMMYNYGLMALYQSGRIDRGSLLTQGWNPRGAPRGVLFKYQQLVEEKSMSQADQSSEP